MKPNVIEFALSGTSPESARSVIESEQQDAPVPIGPGRKCFGGIVSGGGSADPEAATTLDRAPLVLAHPAPDAGVLTGLECPLEAFGGHGAPPAHGLGLLDLQERGAGRPDREEQLRVLVAADRIVTPVHGGNSPCFGWGNELRTGITYACAVATVGRAPA